MMRRFLPRRAGVAAAAFLGAGALAAIAVLNVPPVLSPVPAALSAWMKVPAAGRAATTVGATTALPVANGAALPSGELAYRAGGVLYVLRAGSSRALRIGTGEYPGWSADGRKLAYLVPTGKPYADTGQLHIVNADGTENQAVPGLAPISPGQFAWSPTSETLAVALTPQSHGKHGGIVLVNSQGVVTTLTHGSFGDPMWSPDGRELASAEDVRRNGIPNDLPGSDTLYTIDVQTGALTALVTSAGNGILLAAWSPDQRFLTYWVDPQHSGSLAADGLPLYRLDLATKTSAPLTRTLPNQAWVATAPPSEIVLVSGGLRQIWTGKAVDLCNLASGTCRRLPTPPGTVTLDPALGPGGRVAYVQAANRGFTMSSVNLSPWLATRTLWVAAAGGAKSREIVAAGTGVYNPIWSTNGQALLFIRQGAIWSLQLQSGRVAEVVGTIADQSTLSGFYGFVDWGQTLAWHP